MKKISSFLLLISFLSNQAFSDSWSGTSTTYGNTTYHNFHSNGITVLPAREKSNNNNAAYAAGGAAIGFCLGVLCVKAFQSIKSCYENDYERCKNKIDYYLNGYTYESHEYYVSVIYYSDLPEKVKRNVIDSLNYYYKSEYLQQGYQAYILH